MSTYRVSMHSVVLRSVLKLNMNEKTKKVFMASGCKTAHERILLKTWGKGDIIDLDRVYLVVKHYFPGRRGHRSAIMGAG